MDFISLSLFIVTWNVATKSPPENLENLLNIQNFQTANKLPDFYFIGLQEVKMDCTFKTVWDTVVHSAESSLPKKEKCPWTTAFTKILSEHGYVKLKTRILVGIVLNVFCLRKHVTHIRRLYTDRTATGILDIWGNKGGVSACFELFGCSICVVNSHLAAHDEKLDDRIKDYKSIVDSQRFPVGKAAESSDIFSHDYVFWFGDLNFRLNNEGTLTPDAILNKIKAGKIEELLEFDQLKQVKGEKKAFVDFQEMAPKFPPTFKFIVDPNNATSSYNLKRRPAWTDRILYKVKNDATKNITLKTKQESYSSCPQYTVSDHKPVFSRFTIDVFKEFKEEKQVEIVPLNEWTLENKNKATITILDGGLFESNKDDWIGLYKGNFGGLDEHVEHVHIVKGNSVVIEGKQCTVTFPESAISEAGPYILLYFTSRSNSVLGTSNTFNVNEKPK